MSAKDLDTEIRGLVDSPARLLSLSDVVETYSLEDMFYIPETVSLEEPGQWHPRDMALRLRSYCPTEHVLLHSVHTYDGAIKTAEKKVIAKGAKEELEKVAKALGFKHVFTIARKSGQVLRLKEYPETTFVLEEIENLGWSFEAHVHPGEDETFLERVGLSRECLLNGSLPAEYWARVVRL